MATRSLIGLQVDNRIKYVYCHWDGYPEHNGQILIDHYMTSTKIEQLIELGDLSFLAPEIGEQNDFDNPNSDIWNPNSDICCFYGRDRSEKNTEYRECSNLNDLIDAGYNRGVDYVYLFDGNDWLVSRCYSPSCQYKQVRSFLKKVA